MARYAITDIHGCCKTFKQLLESLDFSKEDQLYILGDYIDRGPDSKGVIDHIWKLQKEGHRVECLKGNHEEKMLLARHDVNQCNNWKYWGGKETLESFAVKNITDIEEAYFTWMEGLPNYLLLDDYVLVHAGLNFKIPDPLVDQVAMRWIRNWYHETNLDWLEGRVVLHGHTPVSQSTIEGQLKELTNPDTYPSPYLDLDNGCVYTSRPDHHQLCAFDMDKQQLFFQEYVS